MRRISALTAATPTSKFRPSNQIDCNHSTNSLGHVFATRSEEREARPHPRYNLVAGDLDVRSRIARSRLPTNACWIKRVGVGSFSKLFDPELRQFFGAGRSVRVFRQVCTRIGLTKLGDSTGRQNSQHAENDCYGNSVLLMLPVHVRVGVRLRVRFRFRVHFPVRLRVRVRPSR